jgi:hypothetical protein
LPPATDVDVDLLRLTIFDPHDEATAEAVIVVKERTRGLVEPAVRMFASSAGGAFDIELLTDLDSGNSALELPRFDGHLMIAPSGVKGVRYEYEEPAEVHAGVQG